MAFQKTIKLLLFGLSMIMLLSSCRPQVVAGEQVTAEKRALIPVTDTNGAEITATPGQAAQPAAAQPPLFIPQISNGAASPPQTEAQKKPTRPTPTSRPPTATATATATTRPVATNTPAATPTQPPSGGGGALVADDTVIDQFAAIPQSAIDAAKARKLLFYHQSTGGYIDADGLECLAGHRGDWDGFPAECATYALNPAQYARTNWNTPFWPQAMADAAAKMDQFMSLMTPSVFSTYDVIGMKFCYVDGWNQDFEYYRSHMEELEAAHPGKTFIWATSALWHDPGSACDASNPFNSCAAIADFNNQVRAYARAHNKPLYDIASIESNGGSCTVAGYEGLCAEYYADSGGHPTPLASLRLAKGMWWLMARIGGWQP